ncbi:MAG: DUF4446 family protein [Candidatus Pacebacteria bacterium]|nr:DUF4446 family protein [Candidatus Paceibacterota bacterium]MCF7862937.1 DUF4446 family protein [Candidatus Paceibacterota bacterium]
MELNPITIITAILTLIILLGVFWIVKTEKRLQRFFAGKKGKDLEDTIENLQLDILNLQEEKNKIQAQIAVLQKKAKESIRGVETIRFNPFPEQGGNQSFAIAMINEEENGVILSSLYARERMSIFAKPIKNGISEHSLTEEEKEALQKASVKK